MFNKVLYLLISSILNNNNNNNNNNKNFIEMGGLMEHDIERLSVFETRILRKIYGPVKENGEWRRDIIRNSINVIKHQISYRQKVARLR